MKDLYIDFDGVVLDTISQLYNDEKFKDLASEEELKEYFISYPWEDIIVDEYIINDSINAIKKIIESGKFNVSILTHINSLEEGILKVNYLRRHFNDITVILCPKEISKTKMVHTKDAILIDDFSGNLREWKEEGGISIKFASFAEAEKDFPVITSLTRVLEMF